MLYFTLQGESGSAIKNNQDMILDISSDILHLDGDSLVPKSIERACLEDAKVLNQVDKKFIAVVAGKTLAMIDQVIAFLETISEHFASYFFECLWFFFFSAFTTLV